MGNSEWQGKLGSQLLADRDMLSKAWQSRSQRLLLPFLKAEGLLQCSTAGGFTPLHLATLKNSPAAMQVLLGAGASMDAGISDAGNTPHLAKGSTALHIAAARGSQPCCSVLLDFQASSPGVAALQGTAGERLGRLLQG